jgi:serine/threonine-protein kinase
VRGPELERYEILSELGQGGMSVVYRARDKQLSRLVAVKVLHEFLARQADARKRFHREAVAVAKLHHPGILEIFDYSGPDAKDSYIVTELIEGETLRELFDRRGKPPYPELGVLIVAELIRALKHAHEQSVIHRDLKPENVMITKSGVLKLMDFGLAQLMDGGTKLTQTGTLLGSPAHMAPEVIDGKMSDARADLFSMGTILYWLATGKLPFEAQNPSALFKKILDGKYEDPQMLEPKIGNGLARIIQRALEPDPEQRYQDVTEIATDLDLELEAVGLLPSDVQVKKYLADPERYASELGPKLVSQLAGAGKQALAEGNVARAMDRFNRVLAIDPDHHEVKGIVRRVGRRKELARRAKQLAAFAAIGALAGGAGYGAIKLFPRPVEEPKPVETSVPAVGLQSIASTATLTAVAIAEDPPPARPPVLVKKPLIKKAAPIVTAVSDRPDAGAQADAAEAVKPPAPAMVRVKVVVGGVFATSLFVDGTERGKNIYQAYYELAPGTHEIVAHGSKGQRERRVIEIDERGAVFALDAKGRLPVRQNELRIDLVP